MGYIRVDVKRCFTSVWFFISVIGVALTYFMGDFGDLTEGMINSSRYDVLSFMDISSSIGYFSEITILLSALPFAMSFCEDIGENYIKFLVIRGNIFKYAFSKIIVCIISSILCIFIGKILIIVFLSIKLPLVSETTANYEVFTTGIYGKLLINKQYILYFLINILFTAIICSIFCIIGITITAYIKNKFLAITAPIIAYFICFQVGEAMKLPYYMRINRLMNGNFILGEPITNIMYVFGIAIVSYIIFMFIFYKGVSKYVKG